MASRYAGSLFDLASEAGNLDEVEKELARVEAMLADSADLRRLVVSPVFSADDQLRAISAIADRAGFKGLVGNFLRVVARNRRLFALPGMIAGFRRLAAEARGEVAADVITAHTLDAAQQAELRQMLKAVAGKDVVLNLTVDPSILGGLVVRIGSRQIDTSLKTKLNSLKLALKEVG